MLNLQVFSIVSLELKKNYENEVDAREHKAFLGAQWFI